MSNSDTEEDGNNNDIGEKVNQLYKTKILDLKDKFVSSLRDAPQVVLQLEKQNVITENERISIISKPIRQHQKEALFYMIARKHFEDIDRIISALQITGNENLRASLLLLKIKIWKEYPFTRKQVKIKPVLTFTDTFNIDDNEDNYLDEDNGINKEKTKSKRKRQDDDPIGPLRIDSIPLRPKQTDVSTEDTIQSRIHRAAEDCDVDSLEHWLKSTTVHPYLPDHTGRTPLHAAVLGKNSKAALQCVELLIKRETELLESESPNGLMEEKLAKFLNHQCKLGNTVLHLAADSESGDLVKHLIDKFHCDAFIRNKNGITPLDLMYIRTPDAVLHLLNGALPTVSSNHLSDGKLTLEIDFRTIIGIAQNHQNDNGKYTETEMLAKLVHQNKQASKMILPHVIVKTFLDLKWAKMKMWLYTSIILHILLHLWYTFFVVQTFLIVCPYSIQMTKKQNSNDSLNGQSIEDAEEETKQRNIFSYLFGDMSAVRQVFSIYGHETQRNQVCQLPVELTYQAYAFIIIGIFFILKEIYEGLLVKRIFSNGADDGMWTKFLNGILGYLKSVENILQLIFVFLMCGVSTLAFRTNILDFYYSAAAFSIIIAWALILLQVGNFYGLGSYVQILGKVIKSFATMIGTYMVLIIAFSIAFSILFPQDKPFQTLPKSFGRVIIMMTGELNYDETFYNEDADSNQVPIPLAGHIIYTSFVVMVTIILINLLIGLTVSDVQGLRDKSEVILRSIQVEQLFVMENALIRLGWIFLFFKKLWRRIRGKTDDGSKVHLDIFVIDPNDIQSIQGMVLKKSIKEIPKNLQREMRTLARSSDDYTKEYLIKYLN